MDRRQFLGAVGTGVVTGIAGCVDAPPGGSGETEIVDLAGRTVMIPESPERIVAVGSGCLRLVVQLEATDTVVGVEHDETTWRREVPYNIAAPELSTTDVIGGNGGDPESIVAAEPDLICSTGASEELETLAERTGLPVVGLTTGQFIDLGEPLATEVWEIAGEALDRGDRANELIEFVEAASTDLRERIDSAGDADPPSTYVTGISFRGGQGLDSTRPLFAPFELLGDVHNVASDVGFDGVPHVTISPEQLLTWDPDVIFVDRTNVDLIEADLSETSAYRELSALQTGSVYGMLPHAQYGLNHTHALANAYGIGSVLYPDAFSDVDLDRRFDEIYEAVLGARIYDEIADIYGAFGRLDLQLDG